MSASVSITMPPAHPLAEIFPLLDGAAFDDLAADIKEHGQQENIILFEGQILDGRNRWRACVAAGVPPETTTWVGTEEEARALVVSRNLHRRHLNESQRAMVAARLETLDHGQKKADMPTGISRGDAADLCNVGERSVARAAVVLDHGVPELVAAVVGGDVAVGAAEAVARLPEEEQQEIVAQGPKAVRERARKERTTPAVEKEIVALEPANDAEVLPDPNSDGQIYVPAEWDENTAPAEWDESDFLCDVRAQLDVWRDEWLRHKPHLRLFVIELRLNLGLLEKEDARLQAKSEEAIAPPQDVANEPEQAVEPKVNTAAFVRSLPAEMSAKDVVQKAREAGIVVAIEYVYRIRKRAQKSAGRTGKRAKKARAGKRSRSE